MKHLFAIFIALLLSTVAVTASAYDPQCEKNKTLSDTLHCENIAMDAADAELNTIYNKLLGFLDKNEKIILREAQRGWIKYRDGNFAIASAMDSKGGQAALHSHIKYMRQKTIVRVKELTQLHTSVTRRLAALKAQKQAKKAEQQTPAATPAPNAPKTVVKSKDGLEKLLGSHTLRLQWLSSELPGKVRIENRNGVVMLSGKQAGESGEMFISGRISTIREDNFTLHGTVVTRANFIDNGKSCTRKGKLWFLQKQGRPFWRLQSITNPCTGVSDYVDIFIEQNTN